MRGSFSRLLIAVSILSTVPHVVAQDDICEASTCYEQNSIFDWASNLVSNTNRCDREDSACPRCLFVSRGSVMCRDPSRGRCDDDEVLCKARRTPPTPTPVPTIIDDVDEDEDEEEDDDSELPGSWDGIVDDDNTPSPTPTEKDGSEDDTPIPTTATSSSSGNSTPSPFKTSKSVSDDQMSSDVSGSSTNGKESEENSGMSLGLIALIAGGGVAVVAVLLFFVWKKTQDDEDSDDEEIPTYKPTAYGGVKSTTAGNKPPVQRNPMEFSPRLGAPPTVVAHSIDFGSPSTIDQSRRTGAAYAVDIDIDSPRGGAGNIQTSNQFRSKRTASTASVEF